MNHRRSPGTQPYLSVHGNNHGNHLQESTRDHLKILPDPKEDLVEEIAAQLGLRRVGWIFTDLVTLAGKLLPKGVTGDTLMKR